MKRVSVRIFLLVAFCFCFFSVYASENDDNQKIKSEKGVFTPQKYSSKKDMAFISVMGSRPDSKALQGFQRAVLYNAQGVLIKKVDISSDSIYSLDKMLQENKTRGPLFIRMIR